MATGSLSSDLLAHSLSRTGGARPAEKGLAAPGESRNCLEPPFPCIQGVAIVTRPVRTAEFVSRSEAGGPLGALELRVT